MATTSAVASVGSRPLHEPMTSMRISLYTACTLGLGLGLGLGSGSGFGFGFGFGLGLGFGLANDCLPPLLQAQ